MDGLVVRDAQEEVTQLARCTFPVGDSHGFQFFGRIPLNVRKKRFTPRRRTLKLGIQVGLGKGIEVRKCADIAFVDDDVV